MDADFNDESGSLVRSLTVGHTPTQQNHEEEPPIDEAVALKEHESGGLEEEPPLNTNHEPEEDNPKFSWLHLEQKAFIRQSKWPRMADHVMIYSGSEEECRALD
ncbi:hypothetical protein FRB97_005372, partial [Tulasnella sp. 331]